MARAALTLLVLLVASASAQQSAEPLAAPWHQLRGDAGHSGVARGLMDELDVIATWRATDEQHDMDFYDIAGLVETPHGLLFVATPLSVGIDCQLVAIRDPAGVTEVITTFPCPGSHQSGRETGIVAYDAARDVVIITMVADRDGPFVQARSASTGELVWSRSAFELGALPASTPAGFPTSVPEPRISGPLEQDRFWTLDGGALDAARDRLVLPVSFHSEPRGVIASVRLQDGSLEWARAPVPNMPRDFLSPPPLLPYESDTETTFHPEGLSLTTTGIAATGFFTGGPLRQYVQSVFFWMTLEGVIIDMRVSQIEDLTITTTLPHAPSSVLSNWPATRGEFAAAVEGENVYLVDPRAPGAVAFPYPDAVLSSDVVGGPIWYGDTLLVTQGNWLAAFTTSEGRPLWKWQEPARWRIYDVVVRPPGEAILLAYLDENRTTEVAGALFRLDLATGHVLQRVPLPDTVLRESISQGNVGLHGRLLPLSDGRLLLMDGAGNVALLGRADDALRPSVVVADAYPSPREPASLRLDDRGASTVVLSWGDGEYAEEAAGTLQHAYDTPGDRVVYATALHADGRTATTRAVFHVGAAPPPQLNAVQQAFAPENQNVTFGVLGLVLTLVGFLVALYVRRRRRGLLADELARIGALRRRGETEPEAALAGLALLRRRFLDDLAGSRLDDAQFGTLEIATEKALRVLRHRVLGRVPHLSAGLREELEVALHDGQLSESSEAALLADVASEPGLRGEDRERLRRLVAALRLAS